MKIQPADRDDEGISKLPAPMLHHILSLLPQEEAARTCVLSKSWRLVSTSPNFVLRYSDFRGDKEKFMDVLDKSLQVYSDQKLRIESFSLTMYNVDDPELVSLLRKWIPTLFFDMGVKKLHLSFTKGLPNLDLPSAVFESESLQELHIENCYLRPINYIIGNNNHLKKLNLYYVCIQQETFAKIMSSCPLIEHLSLHFCVGITTINMCNHQHLKSFELTSRGSGIEIHLPSTIGPIIIDQCPSWFRHCNYFPSLTCLSLEKVHLSDEWFNSFSRNFPCLEELHLLKCEGFDECRLSSRLIKNLDIEMHKSTIKATIDTPSIIYFRYKANISQSISFATTSGEWNSHIELSLDLDASLWFLKLSELIAEFSQSQINSLVLYHDYSGNDEHIEHLPDISVCCDGSSKPVAVKSWSLIFLGLYYYDSFFSDLMNGLYRIFRPTEIEQDWYAMCRKSDLSKRNEVVEFLCKTLQMGRWEDQRMSFWQQDLEEVSLEVKNSTGSEEWHPGRLNWSEYLAASLPASLRSKYSYYKLRFRLKWRE